MKMEKYKILTEFVKDISVETKDVQTYLFVKDYISKYQLSIDIGSKPTKNKLVEITTTLKFEDKQNSENVIKIIKKLVKEFNISFVIATHNLSMVKNFDKIVKLSEGKIV